MADYHFVSSGVGDGGGKGQEEVKKISGCKVKVCEWIIVLDNWICNRLLTPPCDKPSTTR